MINIKKYPIVKQIGEKDCGAASLAMIINYYNGNYSLDELRDLTNTNRNGTTAYDLVEAATKIGFDASCYKCYLEDINKNNIVLPCIANVIIEGKYKHFIVIYEIDFEKKKIIIADPAQGIKKISFNYFKKIFNNYLIMLIPIKTIPVVTNSTINYHYFINLFKSERKYIKNIIASSLFVTIFSIISSFYIELLISIVTKNKSSNYLFLVFIIFFLVYILKNILEYIRSKILIKIQNKIDSVITLDTYNNVLSLPYHYYRVRSTGDIISRINDLANVKDLITKIIMVLIIDLPLTIITIFLMFLISKLLFLFSLLIVLLYLFIIKLFKKSFNNYIIYLKKEKAEISSTMVESISGFETVKGLKIKDYIFKKFKNMYEKYLALTYNYQKTYLKEIMFKNIISDLGFIVITFIGFYYVSINKLSLGSLFTFNALIVYFLEPLKSVLAYDADFKEAKCSYKRIIELDTRCKEDDVTDNHLKGKIDIKNLSYSYNNQKKVLKDINLTIDAGQKVMVLGPSGSGKSTLFKMLLKYFAINSNHIFIDDKDINTISNSSNIKYINQIETLFTDTLYNNLTLGKSIKEKQLNEVINICSLEKIIEKDSLGINQLIEENGFNLSGGERQRIVLARTILLGFDILIIDEGLNQVDINLERKILSKLINKYKDKTIIIISHRLNNKDLYDKVITLKKGKVLPMTTG